MNPTEADTRSRILDAAERLFMAHGFEATTLRMITTDAGANLAAVNYHFGSKEALIAEVFRRRLTWLNEQRLAALDALEAGVTEGNPRGTGDTALKPRQIVEAFFGVAIRMASDTERGGRTFMRLLGRTYTEPSEFVRRFLAEEYAAVVIRFKAALVRALPDVPQEEILWRFHFMMGAMSYAISGADALHILSDVQPGDKNFDADTEALYARLMSFLIGGLRAPLPDLQTPQKPSRLPPHKAA